MTADELRSIQAPLKQRYRGDPASALVCSRAEGTLVIERVACSVQVWKGETEAGLHPAGGGTGEQACSADMLLQALVGCAGVTLASVATAMNIPIRTGKVIAEGTWDARGTLGVDRAVPIALTDVNLSFELDTDAEPAKIARLIEMTEHYCVIAQTLRNPPRLTVDYTLS